jgi:lactose/L-arabinose transport system ATP-binding protein
MGFGLKMTGTDKNVIKERVGKAASILQLQQLLTRTPKQLSGGQRQRVAIGRAIVREPKVFLFDEPLSNLDAELRVEMRLEIAKLHKSLGSTMIYVTHDQVEAMTLADKIVVLRGGNIEQVGSPIKLYDDPDNIFVAGFIGSPKMNFLDAEVLSSEGGMLNVKLTSNGDVSVPMKIAGKHPAKGSKLTLGIRPEHFDPKGKIRISAPVDVIENLGGVSYAYTRPDEHAPLIIELKGNRNAAEDAVLETGFNPQQAFLFDSATGLRLR